MDFGIVKFAKVATHKFITGHAIIAEHKFSATVVVFIYYTITLFGYL
jgi:hypothetical protein